MMEDITFSEHDKFKRKDFAENLTKVITKFYPFHKEAFVLGLNAGYGAGKTTFLQMWKNSLENAGHKVIYINSWETDFDDEPLIPIIGALLDELTEETKADKVVVALQSVLMATALIANDLTAKASGIDPIKRTEDIRALLQSENTRSIGESLYKEYSFKKKAYADLKSELNSYVEALEKKPLIIMIDELDRVRPDYAVKFLEAIKHIFSAHGVCFVLAVDRVQLQISIEQLYGKIDFENYYRRFITREANLPELQEADLKPFLNHLASDFFDAKRGANVNFVFGVEEQGGIIKSLENICKMHRFAPRKIESYFRIFAQFMAIEEPKRMAAVEWTHAAILLVAIMLHDPQLYRGLGKGPVPTKLILNYIDGLTFSEDFYAADRRHILYMMLAFNLSEQVGTFKDQAANAFLESEGIEINGPESTAQRNTAMRTLVEYTGNRFGRVPDISGFQVIYKALEHWRPFLS